MVIQQCGDLRNGIKKTGFYIADNTGLNWFFIEMQKITESEK